MKSFNLTVLFCILFSFVLAQAKVEVVIGSIPISQNVNLLNVIPNTDDSEILISRDQYVISYNRQRRSPNWVAWKLESKDIGSVSRTNVFLKDPGLENYLNKTGSIPVVDSTEYNGSCFDRGHQVPSKDRTDTSFNNQETFLTSNIIPQTAHLNRVVWEHLEQYTRDIVQKNGKTAYIVAGPIYDEDFGFIGPHHDIPVPSKNFKMIIFLEGNQNLNDINSRTEMIAVIMPNLLEDGSKPFGGAACTKILSATTTNVNDWQQYKTTPAEIEKLAHIHFTKR